MKRLSRPLDEIQAHYDVVVIGSGYGGGVAASRLARCGKHVCLLERGREFMPGEFPDRLGEGLAEIQINAAGKRIGSRTSLFEVHTGKDINAVVGCGLGGTSLINANVCLQPDESIFKDTRWPSKLMDDTYLNEGFIRAKNMLEPKPIPKEIANNLHKVNALKKAAKAIDAHCTLPPLNVSFEDRVNSSNVKQPSCVLCGDCCSGCNTGAKNTVQMTYLPDAVNHGAKLFTEVNVKYLRKEENIWRIFFETGEDDHFNAPEQSITADIVVLAAGTLGSNEILLRSQKHGLAVSDQLGKKFSGNGGVIAFGYNNDEVINGIGVGVPPKVETETEIGPCIAGMIDLTETEDITKSMVIEEGTIPSLLSVILPKLMSTGSTFIGEDTDFDLSDELNETKRSLKSLLMGPYSGAVRNTQTFLATSHDDGKGRIELKGDSTTISWPNVARQANFVNVNNVIKRATAATGGTYIKNPLSHHLLGETLITVHPLGGCSMGESSSSGVVNHKCQVFNTSENNKTQEVYEGLYVCDGSVIPSPLGINPLLTITAIAERAMIHLAADHNWVFDCASNPDAPLRDARPEPSKENTSAAGIKFTERMSGFWSSSIKDDFEAAERHGKTGNNNFSFILNIVVDDIDVFIANADHSARMTGIVECQVLSSEPLDVFNGRFNLFSIDENSAEVRRMDYRMTLMDRSGKSYSFIGYKHIHDDPGLDIWSDTTRLFFDLYDDANKHIGRGVLSIVIGDFLTQMRTMHGFGGNGSLDRTKAMLKFAQLFGSNLYSSYAGIAGPLHRYDYHKIRKKRELRVSDPEIHYFKTGDGFTLRLMRYRGGTKGPVILSHGLGVSSLIFSIDTINTNLLEFLYSAGYDCWLLDYRASIHLSYANEVWTADDVAREDYPAAIAKVREITGVDTVQMFVHCYGATTFTMAMLMGLKHVRSAVISQISVDVIMPWWPQGFLSHLRIPSLLSAFGLDALDAKADKQDKFWLKWLDRIIRIALPIVSKETSQSATSNRITAIYGQLYELDQLNSLTYLEGLPEMFGKANMQALRHLSLMAQKKHIVNKEGKDCYRPHIDRLKLPLCFIHGAKNQCYKPESTKRTYDSLVKRHGSGLYERHVIPAYGHIDCIFGKNAAIDVYPHILRHLEKNN